MTIKIVPHNQFITYQYQDLLKGCTLMTFSSWKAQYYRRSSSDDIDFTQFKSENEGSPIFFLTFKQDKKTRVSPFVLDDYELL